MTAIQLESERQLFIKQLRSSAQFTDEKEHLIKWNGDSFGLNTIEAAWQGFLLARQLPNIPDTVSAEMIEAAENVEDLYKRGTPETWVKVWHAMRNAAL